MNEQIKLIALRAGMEDFPIEGVNTLYGNKEIEKFAELIVRECVSTLKKDMELAHIQLIPLDLKMYANGRLHRTI